MSTSVLFGEEDDSDIDTDATVEVIAENTSGESADYSDINDNESIEIFSEDEDLFDVFTKNTNGVLITVTAHKGVFPEGSRLMVNRVSLGVQKEVTEAIDEVRDENQNVAVSYTFDIKIIDAEGNEIQPADGSQIQVSFTMDHITNDNLDTNVYHIPETQQISSSDIEKLEVSTEGDKAIVQTDSFSYYTVEFTYDNKEYVLEGDRYVRLSDILEYVGLTGELTSWQISNDELFAIYRGDEDGLQCEYIYEDEYEIAIPVDNEEGTVLYMVALQMFDTEEWLDVVIDGITYRIIVTDDAYVNGPAQTKITDDRVIQGGTEANFTADMPLATIWINEDIINTNSHLLLPPSTYTQDDYDTYVNEHGEAPKWNIGDIDYDNPANTGKMLATLKYNGERTGMNVIIDTNDNTYGQLYFDFSKGDLSYGTKMQDNVWEGPVVEYKFINAGERYNVDTQQYEKFDVVITYSNIHVSLQNNLDSSIYAKLTKYNILDTNKIQPVMYASESLTGNPNDRSGLKLDVNVKVVDRNGKTIDGSFYFPFVDADVSRSGDFGNLYEGTSAENNYYSEQVVLLDNYGRPTSSGVWEQKIWIPGGAYDKTKSNSQKNNMPYLSNIDSVNGNLRIKPGTYAYNTINRDGYIRPEPNSAGNVNGRDEDFYTGFATLANNSKGGISFRYWGTSAYRASPSGSSTVTSFVLAGNTRINHKLDASSDVGGTIYTTSTGNSDATLSGGELIGNNFVNTPHEISVATGQNVTYTLTPNGGYKIRNVYVKKGDIDILPIVSNAKASIDPNDFDADADGVLDENEQAAYDAAVDSAVDTALSSITGAQRIAISSLQNKGHGVYAYTFQGINEDNSIHVEWEKTQLTLTKNINPDDEPDDYRFTFQIRLWDTSTKETTWRVRARKYNGLLVKEETVKNETPYYLSYYETHTEEGEIITYNFISPDEMTGEENPSQEGWYVRDGTRYIPATDTTVDPNKYYYRRVITEGSILRYYHHILGFNEETGLWEDHVIKSDTPHENMADLGLFDIDKELADNYRFEYDGDYVYNLASYDAENNKYTEYLMWVYDDAIDEDVLVLGNAEMYPEGRPFALSGITNNYIYIWKDGINDYSGKIIQTYRYKIYDNQSFQSNTPYNWYFYQKDIYSAEHYDLINNPDGHDIDTGYSELEGESGVYIITLPAGQNPDVSDLTDAGWDVSYGPVSPTGEVFDMDAAFFAKGATPVAGTNTYQFSVKAGETIDFEGCVPMGWNYEIKEIGMEGSHWELLSNTSNAVKSNYEGEEHVEFINQKRYYDLTIEKETEDDISGEFEFNVHIYKEEIIPGTNHGVTITPSISEGTASYVLNNPGDNLVIPQVATIPGGEYTFGSGNEELDSIMSILIFNVKNSSPFTFTIDEKEWEISSAIDNALGVEVQQYIDEGYTSVSFEPVAYTFSTESETVFHLYDPEVLPDGVTGSNGLYTFTIRNGESVTFEDILFGYKYEITEKEQISWELVSSTNDKGMITGDTVSTFLNRMVNSLTISKQVTGNMGNKTKEFAFTTVFFNLYPNYYYDCIINRKTDGLNVEIVPLDILGISIKDVNGSAISMFYIYEKLEDTAPLIYTNISGKLVVDGQLSAEIWSSVLNEGGTVYFDINGLRYPVTIPAGSFQQGADVSFGSISYGRLCSDADGNLYTRYFLKDGESIVFMDFNHNVQYMITEDDYTKEGYRTTVDGNENRKASGYLTGYVEHNYVNDSTAVVPTKAYSGMLTPILFLMSLGIGCFAYDFKKRDEEEETDE